MYLLNNELVISTEVFQYKNLIMYTTIIKYMKNMFTLHRVFLLMYNGMHPCISFQTELKIYVYLKEYMVAKFNLDKSGRD